MNKILLLEDSRKVDTASIDFGCFLARESGSRLVGILLNNAGIELAPSREYKRTYFGKMENKDGPVLMDPDQSMLYFMEECRKRGVKADVFVDNGSPFEEAVHESRFADLLIVSPDLSFLEEEPAAPTAFVRRLLAKSECPVLLSPHSFTSIKEIVFCYEGSASSLFAMKQFTYLFPEFKAIKASVLEIRNSTLKEQDDQQAKTIAWLQAHYNKVNLHFLPIEARDELFLYFLKKKDLIIVMGAFGRSMLSNFSRKSAAEMVIHTIDLPLFISHH